MINKLKKQLVTDEGMILTPYKCTAGKLTIGVGRNIDDIGITRREALFILDNDINRCILELNNIAPWTDTLDEVRYATLINMCFNLGITRLGKFKKTLKALEAKNFKEAAKEMIDSEWGRNKYTSRRAKRLAQQMEIGKWVY